MDSKNAQLVTGVDVRLGLARGVDALANMVKVTLGPKGQNVMIIERGIPQIVNDGVTIAKKVRLWDDLENAGATIVKNVSKDTEKLYGDGTTTATILAQAILQVGMELTNINYFKLKKAFDFYMDEVEKYLIQNAKIVESDNDLRNIAMVSTNGDAEIADLIVKAYSELGKGCFITIKESPEKVTYLKNIKGLKYDSGWVSPFLTNDKTDRTAKYINGEECHVCYVAGELVDEIQIIPILELQSINRIPLLIIAERIYGEALAVLIKNKLQGNMAVSAVVIPGIKSEHADIMADMIAVTGGEVLNTEDGKKTHDIIDRSGGEILGDVSVFGTVQGFEVGNDYFTLSKDKRDEGKIKERISHIEKEMKKYNHELFNKSAKGRIAKLTSGVGVIYIGGVSDIEINEKMLRAQDAVNALSCAVDKGYLPGGGIGLLRAAMHIEKNVKFDDSVESQKALQILSKAMWKPFTQILINCGMVDSADLNKVAISNNFNMGYNGVTEQFSDLLNDGIIDPLPVTVGALRNAISVASIILSCGGAVLDEGENKNDRIIAGGR